MAEAIRIWQTLDKRIQRDTGYKRSGIILLVQPTRITPSTNAGMRICRAINLNRA